MLQTQTPNPGDVIESDGRETWHVDEVSDDGVTLRIDGCHRDGYVETVAHDDFRRILNDSDFTHVPDPSGHPLTEIKGVGPSTVPRVVHRTGCETPKELVVSYLTDGGQAVADAIRRLDYFHESIHELSWNRIDDEEINMDGRRFSGTGYYASAMLFVRLAGIDHRCVFPASDARGRHHADEEAVSPADITWDDELLRNSSGTLAVHHKTHDTPWDTIDIDTRPSSVERDGDVIRFHVDGTTTSVSADLMDTVETWAGMTIEELNPDDIPRNLFRMCPDEKAPVVVHDPRTPARVAVAPRVE
jgi:hypothetical protein